MSRTDKERESLAKFQGIILEKLDRLSQDIMDLSSKLDSIVSTAGTRNVQRRSSSIQLDVQESKKESGKKPKKPTKRAKVQPTKDLQEEVPSDAEDDSKESLKTKGNSSKKKPQQKPKKKASSTEKVFSNVKAFVRHIFMEDMEKVHKVVGKKYVDKILSEKEDEWKESKNKDSRKADIFYSSLSKEHKDFFKKMMGDIQEKSRKQKVVALAEDAVEEPGSGEESEADLGKYSD